MRYLNLMAVVLAVGVFGGCEWDSTSDSGTWDDSYSWVNFSGLYRGLNGSPFLVADFSNSPSTATGGTNRTITVGASSPDVILESVNAEDATYTGTTANDAITPGTFAIRLDNSVAFLDDGEGNLVGQNPIAMEGTITYSTGAWSVRFSDPPNNGSLEATYTYNEALSSGDSSAATGLNIAGGSVASMQVEQTGNRLRFRDSNGYTYEGQLSVVALAGGDTTGRSSGDVSATFEVKGQVGSGIVTISGTFSGSYIAPGDVEFENESAAIIFGEMSDRIMQGVWIQPGGTADVYGVAPQISVSVNVESGTTGTTTTDGDGGTTTE